MQLFSLVSALAIATTIPLVNAQLGAGVNSAMSAVADAATSAASTAVSAADQTGATVTSAAGQAVAPFTQLGGCAGACFRQNTPPQCLPLQWVCLCRDLKWIDGLNQCILNSCTTVEQQTGTFLSIQQICNVFGVGITRGPEEAAAAGTITALVRAITSVEATILPTDASTAVPTAESLLSSLLSTSRPTSTSSFSFNTTTPVPYPAGNATASSPTLSTSLAIYTGVATTIQQTELGLLALGMTAFFGLLA